MLRYRLTAANEVKKALDRRDGSQGAASGVRRIDPAGYAPPPFKPSVAVPRSAAAIAAERRDQLDLQASKLTGLKRIAKKQIFR
jgi:hypothetical protein